MSEEAKKFIELFRQLDFKQTKEFCYMVKGAVFAKNNVKSKEA